MIPSGKGVGGFVKGVRNRLKAQGLNQDQVDKAISAMFGLGASAKPLTIPRTVVKRLAEVLAQDRRAIVVIGRQDCIKVFTFDGFKGLQSRHGRLTPEQSKAMNDKRWAGKRIQELAPVLPPKTAAVAP